jgi:hypothetical protein
MRRSVDMIVYWGVRALNSCLSMPSLLTSEVQIVTRKWKRTITTTFVFILNPLKSLVHTISILVQSKDFLENAETHITTSRLFLGLKRQSHDSTVFPSEEESKHSLAIYFERFLNLSD